MELLRNGLPAVMALLCTLITCIETKCGAAQADDVANPVAGNIDQFAEPFDGISHPQPILPAEEAYFPADWFSGDAGIQIHPYGSIWANMVFATRRTHSGSFTFYVLSAEDEGEPAYDVDARRSRFGLDVNAPSINVAGTPFESVGRIEIDFLGQFLTENRASARIRHAYWQLNSPNTSFLVGQAWDVVSPLRPGTVNLTVGWMGGNIGFRRPQFRLESSRILGGDRTGLVQVSLNQDIVDDFPGEPGVNPESAAFPVVMARAALVGPSNDGLPGSSIGVSAHYGQTGFDFLVSGPPPLSLPPQSNARFNTWSVNLDAEFILSEQWQLRGEGFHGANLSPFLGGIGQGVCPCLRRSIHSSGGWLELVYQWNPQWESHFGTGIDDPANSDSIVGRSLNQFLFANLIWSISDQASTGLEVSWWRTMYQEQRQGLIDPQLLLASTPGESFVFEWMVRFDF